LFFLNSDHSDAVCNDSDTMLTLIRDCLSDFPPTWKIDQSDLIGISLLMMD